jgi:hypothetical protein
LNSATTAVDEDRDSPTERHGVSDRGEDREARVLTDEFEEVFEHLRSLTFFREGSGVNKWLQLTEALPQRDDVFSNVHRRHYG